MVQMHPLFPALRHSHIWSHSYTEIYWHTQRHMQRLEHRHSETFRRHKHTHSTWTHPTGVQMINPSLQAPTLSASQVH